MIVNKNFLKSETNKKTIILIYVNCKRNFSMNSITLLIIMMRVYYK